MHTYWLTWFNGPFPLGIVNVRKSCITANAYVVTMVSGTAYFFARPQ